MGGGGTIANGFLGRPYAVWSGSGLVFNVYWPVYYIQGVQYPTGSTSITLDAADPTNDRIDVIAVDSTGGIKITGTAAASPIKPTVDALTQLEITEIQIDAAATTPTGITDEDIYKENLEWTGSSNVTGANFNDTTDPFAGSKDTSIGSFTNGQYVQYVDGSTHDISDYTYLKFYVKIKAQFLSNTGWIITFKNGTTTVSSAFTVTNGIYAFDRTDTSGYQLVVIPLSEFTFSSATFDTVYFQLRGNNTSGFYFDNIVLQGGIVAQTSLQNAITTIQTPSGAAVADQPNDTFVFVGTGISASGKTITFPAGGSGTPGGADTNVQYNDGGSFGGEAAFTYNKTTNRLNADYVAVLDDAYDATTWNGNLDVPTKNAIRDKIETLGGGISGSGTSGYVTYWTGASSISGESNLYWDATNNRLGINNSTPGFTFDLASSDTEIMHLVGSNATRADLYLQASNTTSQATIYLENNRGSFASYGGFLYSGATNAQPNIFGVSRVDKLFLFADGASNLGMCVGTLVNSPLIFGTDNVERVRITGGGVFTYTAVNMTYTVSGTYSLTATTALSLISTTSFTINAPTLTLAVATNIVTTTGALTLTPSGNLVVTNGANKTAFTSSGTDMVTMIGSNATRATLYLQATNSGAQVTSYFENNRGSFASYGGYLYGGSTNAIGNLFGVSRADKLFVFADGASNLGMCVGTLVNQFLILGTNNTERLRIYGGGNIVIGTGADGGFKLDVNGTFRSQGDVTISDAKNIILNTTTGTKIGTATTQKLSVWNATPIVQPTTAVAEATYVSNAGTNVTDNDTFDGYTLQQVVKALRNIGLLA